LTNLSKYPSIDEEAIERFSREHGLTNQLVRREIGRSTKPLIQWCQQSGILTIDEDGWCRITEHGVIAHKLYSGYTPIWYDRLGFNGPTQSALLLLYSYADTINKKIDRSKLEADAKEAVDDLQKHYDIWDSGFRKLKRRIDFDFYYDVPVKLRQEVKQRVKSMSNDVGIPPPNLDALSVMSVDMLESELRLTSHEKTHIQLGEALGITIPRRECFQTDFEWQTCIRLRVLQYPAYPYQGEFEGSTDLPMASDNPDIILRNNIRTLVECKTRSEWGDVVRYDKRVGGELLMYQQYAEDVKANSALFICDVEGFDEERFARPFANVGKRLWKIVVATWKSLDLIQKEKSRQDSFAKIIEKPGDVEPSMRVLSHTT